MTANNLIDDPVKVSVILPSYNERGNIDRLIEQILTLKDTYSLEILVVDDDSPDGTAELIRGLAHDEPCIRLIRRIGRSGLASAIKEGLLDATGEIAVVMDSDGQHEPSSIRDGINLLQSTNSDLVIGSRFLQAAQIHGLSKQRVFGSTWANRTARRSLARSYRTLTDYMSGFFIVQVESVLPCIRAIDVNGFKFLYELLAISKGRLKTAELPLSFQARLYGDSKLDMAIFWDFLISILHNLCFRLLPRRAISYGIVGLSGVAVQLAATQLLTEILGFSFTNALPIAAITAASSNYLINNSLTFRFKRLRGLKLIEGLLKYLMVASLPVIANVGMASAYYNLINHNSILAQLAGIVVIFFWNYVASSRFVWNTP